MAVITTHVLNGVAGIHAAGVAITLTRCDTGELLLAARTDAGGRLQQDIPAERIDPGASYDLVFAAGAYWAAQGLQFPNPPAVSEMVFRFAMRDPNGRYHIPVNLSPHSHSVWWSG